MDYFEGWALQADGKARRRHLILWDVCVRDVDRMEFAWVVGEQSF